jgi:hypothetical protein
MQAGRVGRLALAGLAGVTVTLAATGEARANCTVAAAYDITAVDNTVTICPTADDRRCPDPEGMLRANPSTGEVVRLGDQCRAGGQTIRTLCYVDECVPPGRYQYGLRQSYDCNYAGCTGPEYYHTVEVTNPLPSGCVPAVPPSPYSAPLPWTTRPTVDCPLYLGDGGLLGDGSVDDTVTEHDFRGLSCSAGGSTGLSLSGKVLAANALALLAGVALLARRRR